MRISSLRTMTAHMSNPFEHSFPIWTCTHPPSSASSTLSTTCCICKTVSSTYVLSHSLRQLPRSTLTAKGEYADTRTTMHHDGLPVPTGKSKPPTGKGGRSDPLTQTDNHMHHTSIIIVILGKHIATMLRHNPYSLLRSTARTNLVERSYSQFFFIIIIIFFN